MNPYSSEYEKYPEVGIKECAIFISEMIYVIKKTVKVVCEKTEGMIYLEYKKFDYKQEGKDDDIY